MATRIILSLVLLIVTKIGFSQSAYNDYSSIDKQTLLFDDLNSNQNGWNFAQNDDEYSRIENGYILLQSLNTSSQTLWISLDISAYKDFEIETRMKIISSNDNGSANYLRWGSSDDNKYEFGHNMKGDYTIDKYDSNRPTGQKYVDYVSFTYTDYIVKNGYNKLTVRKVNNDYYFFINENFIHKMPFESFFGKNIGFKCGAMSTLSIDYLKVSYLEKQKVIVDNTPPQIALYEPSASRGYKIVEANKQLLVRGKATDESGIYEVTINGIDANVNANGDFQQTIKLAVGDNTMTIKATDTKNNAASYTFYVNRQSEVTNNDIVVNDNPAATEEKRIALVIGNSNYGGGQTLKNPANDAILMSQTLQKLGFEVIKRIDANKQSMEQAIRDFSKKLPNCNVALFYYAGHGLQVDGLNYLIPTDAKMNDKSDCKFEAVSVNYVVEEFEKYPQNVNVVILDACRNNPFRSWSRGAERGFKAISPTSGTIISFATSEGSTASDGTGNNGLFTQELVKQMTLPQPIESVFKKTRVQVQKLSNGEQSPQEWSQLTGDFYFKK